MKNRDREIVELLVGKVSIMCIEQIARTWWSFGASGRWRAQQTLERLEHDEWLEQKKGVSRVAPKLSEPLLVWTPGQKPCDFRALAAVLHRRARASVCTTTLWMATDRARSLLGRHGSAHRANPTQTTHELQVAEIMLQYRQSGLNILCDWLGEIEFAHSWPYAQRPDALLLKDGVVIRAVEYGGDYTPERLQILHTMCSEIELSYEIW